MPEKQDDITLSDDNESVAKNKRKKLSKQGVLQKWTNYIQGWQNRFVSCKDGTLCYYKTEEEAERGCKVTTSLSRAFVTTMRFEPLRFDVTIDDNTWFFMVPSETERDEWIAVIEANVHESTAVVTVRSEKFPPTAEVLGEKLLELNTLNSILDRQVSILQQYFDICGKRSQPNLVKDPVSEENSMRLAGNAELTDLTSVGEDINGDSNVKPNAIDFNGEAITFRATAASVLATLSQCVTIASEREEMWQKKLEKAEEEKQQISQNYTELLKAAKLSNASTSSTILADSDSEYDSASEDVRPDSPKQTGHRYTKELDKRIGEQLASSVKETATEGEDAWDLLAEEGELKIYRQDHMLDSGILCDTLKAVHCVRNVTAREMCYYFWNIDLRTEWEETVEQCRPLHILDENTIVVYQTHKKVWMTAQRDCLYVSSLLQIPNTSMPATDRTPRDTWMVCNFSIDEEVADQVEGCVRATADVTLLCQTFVTASENGKSVSRDDLQCDFIYVSNVNPGGYVPTALLRQISKREYPKFLKRLNAFVHEKTRDKDIWF